MHTRCWSNSLGSRRLADMPSACPHCDQSVCLWKHSVTRLQLQSELQGPLPADLGYIFSAGHIQPNLKYRMDLYVLG